MAKENLERQNYAVYLPRIKVWKRRRDRQTMLVEPLFPRYLFVRPESPEHSIAPIRSTLGVSSMVRFGQNPAIMRQETLDKLQAFERRQNESSEAAPSPFQAGERVLVADGPFAGLAGLVSSVSRDRVVILMHLLGAEARVELSHHQIGHL